MRSSEFDNPLAVGVNLNIQSRGIKGTDVSQLLRQSGGRSAGVSLDASDQSIPRCQRESCHPSKIAVVESV
jgi:hypothetical protein